QGATPWVPGQCPPILPTLHAVAVPIYGCFICLRCHVHTGLAACSWSWLGSHSH
ncbi:unnamed protein product, partial [Chrysoparadoxa australica]